MCQRRRGVQLSRSRISGAGARGGDGRVWDEYRFISKTVVRDVLHRRLASSGV